jgi:hypothetical protein
MAKFVLVIVSYAGGGPSSSDGYIWWSHSTSIERFVFPSEVAAQKEADAHLAYYFEVVKVDKRICKLIRNRRSRGCYADGRNRE